jgi:NTP pyrophosphatase (non-canonical NTP hydrolase)
MIGEVGELSELFQWLPADCALERSHEEPLHTRVEEEISDVLLYLVCLADVLDIDLASAASRKLESSAQKYKPGSKPTQYTIEP